jgi:ammonium transporter Rh
LNLAQRRNRADKNQKYQSEKGSKKMRHNSSAAVLFVSTAITLICSQGLLAAETGQSASFVAAPTVEKAVQADLASLVDVQKYNRSIHIMAMLLVGFGFLMVFVKKYGRSAVTATYLLVSVAIPVYFSVKSCAIFGEASNADIDKFILAEFAAASLLICAGAVLGRLKMFQYMVLGVIFTFVYMLNEWVVVGGGFGLVKSGFADTGGSIVIHAFGALFGLGVIKTMTTSGEFTQPIETDASSDRFSMLGSMVLWIFWPSFCAALVAPEMLPRTIVNVVLALCGATVATYFASIVLRKGKISIADIANASLAGGVAIGSTCDHANHPTAFLIGLLAGAVSTFGFAVIQGKLQSKLKCIDTCGVLNLHGWPGLMGGLAAVFVVDGINKSNQLKGIAITIIVALVAGYITGKILSAFGRKALVYADSDEFVEAEA